jgi:hypothetical protein
VKINGDYFSATIQALKLNGAEKNDAKRNAQDIVKAIIGAYGGKAAGNIKPSRTPPKPVTGLVYGRIQSGKTRAMIAATAMAFDNKFRIAIVLTSNINDLVNQTHFDFSSALPGLRIFTKDSDLAREVAITKLYMQAGNGCLLLVCSKGTKSLKNISAFLKKIGANKYPTIIFDDEGDQASLDMNTRKRSRSVVRVAPSPVNKTIQSTLRNSVPRHVYVSVTGTPQAVLLQSADSRNRPSFIIMLPPGKSYVGGDDFFSEDEPEDNAGLVTLVDRNEKQQLLTRGAAIPDGLRKSLLFFLVSSAAAIRLRGVPERGYSYLCHPSLKNDEQATAEKRINRFLNEVLSAVYGTGNRTLLKELVSEYKNLKSTLKAKTPSFPKILQTVAQYLPTRRLLVINARVKRQGIDYGRGLNFLIGGNTLGRGIAIRDLLVTYYVRDSRISQIDTMHQHARMYGYRSGTIAFTRLFIPRHLYYRFRDIHHSDAELRLFIQQHLALPSTFPVEYTPALRPTRTGVLDVKRTDTLSPGQQIYPNYIALPQRTASYRMVLQSLCKLAGLSHASEEELETRFKRPITTSPASASKLIKPIKTRSKNTWQDRTIDAVIRMVAQRFDNQVLVRFRTADRTVRSGGFISTGTLSGAEVTAAKRGTKPTLWVMSALATPNSEVARGQRFMYPTFVIPDQLQHLFVFNRGH